MAATMKLLAIALLLAPLSAQAFTQKIKVTTGEPVDGSCPGPKCTLGAALSSLEDGCDALIDITGILRIVAKETTELSVRGSVTITGGEKDMPGTRPGIVPAKPDMRFLVSTGNLNITMKRLAFFHFSIHNTTTDMAAGAVIYSLSDSNPTLTMHHCLVTGTAVSTWAAWTVIGGAVSWTCGVSCDIMIDNSVFSSNTLSVSKTADTVFGGAVGLFSGGSLMVSKSIFEFNTITNPSAATTVAGSAIGATGPIVINSTTFTKNKGGVLGFEVFSDIGNVEIRDSSFTGSSHSAIFDASITPAMIHGARIRMFNTKVAGSTDANSKVTVSSSDEYFSNCSISTTDKSPARIGAWQIFNRNPHGPVWTNSTWTGGTPGLGFAGCKDAARYWPCPAACTDIPNPAVPGTVLGYLCS